MNSIKQRFKALPVLTKTLPCLLIGAFIGFLIGGTFLIFEAIAVIAACAVTFWALGLALLFLWSLVNRGPMKPLKIPFLPWVFAASLLFAFVSGGAVRRAWSWRQVENFVVIAAPQLELEKKQGRAYPKQLPLPLLGQKPEALSYSSSGEAYVFSYHPPHYLFEFWDYHSDTRTWQHDEW